MEPLFLSLIALIAGTAVTWKGGSTLESSAGRLAAHYELPAVVQGSLIVAVGSSFPELSATVLSTLLHGEFELGMAAIVGSAIFNILVIPGVAGLTGEPTTHGARLVYRDAQFYLTSVAILLLAFSFALIYEPGEERLTGSITRPIAAIPLLLYGLYLFLQQQDTAEHHSGDGETDEATSDGETSAKSARPGRDWLLLLGSLAAILAGVEALVRAVLWLGDWLGAPSFLMGVTVVAAATSLPDAVVSFRAAQRGQAAVSLGNVLGSNIFDLLVALPAGVLIAGTTTVDFAVAAPLMAMLTLATVVLFALLRTDLTLTRREAGVLLLLYAVFISWAVSETFDWVDLIAG